MAKIAILSSKILTNFLKEKRKENEIWREYGFIISTYNKTIGYCLTFKETILFSSGSICIFVNIQAIKLILRQ